MANQATTAAETPKAMLGGAAGHEPLQPFSKGEKRTVILSFKANLNAGEYFLTVALAQPDATKEDVIFDALELIVEQVPSLHTSSIVNLDVVWAKD